MKNLTKEQQIEVRILIQLGDSKELAIKTILAKEERSTEMYQTAYYS